MLATSKMTGLDLVGGVGGGGSLGHIKAEERDHPDSKRSSTSSDEMLSTPKLLPESAGPGSALGLGLSTHPGGHFSKAAASFMMQSRHAALASLASNAGSISPTSRHMEPSHHTNNNIQMSGNDSDMLTTPVVTTPKTSDQLWLTHTPTHLKLNFEAGGISPGPGSSLQQADRHTPLEPPSNLPMDSDINLRSPCEGIVAKRREKFRRKQQSSFSDSNSCDTPTSENSPRDLSMAKIHNSSIGLDLKQPLSAEPSSNPSTPTLVKRSPTPPIHVAASLPPSFKQPHKPQALHIKDVADLSAHYTPSPLTNPSPLTLPSPNWDRVNRYFEGSGSLLKTPKLLDGQLTFTFNGDTPLTPRSAKQIFEATGHDPYSRPGLSPRDPPRLNIPETPTDLSPSCRNTSSELSSSHSHHSHHLQQKIEDESDAAEDLSTHRPTIKQELTPRSPPPLQQIMHPEIKIEEGQPPGPAPSPHISQQPGPIVTGSSSFDLRIAAAAGGYGLSHSGVHHLTHAGVYARYVHPNPRDPSPPSAVVSTAGAPPTGYREHHNASPNYPPPPLAHNWSQPWPSSTPHDTMSMDSEASVSPPHYSNTPNNKPPRKTGSTDSALMSTITEPFKKAKLEVQTGPSPSRKPRASGGATKASKCNKGGSTPSMAGKGQSSDGTDQGGNKRVYSCPHCQRSYDWNYNLNRHLKYECGKENAFQCAKCGRKFPHKQNCVYHLKRKHKIVCETIDQYMANGLVIFRGSANAGGQHIANPQ